MSWQQKRSMTPAEYEWAIDKLRLNKAQAGRFLGVSERTSHRYFDGDAEIPEASVMLLRSMIAHGEVPVVPPAPKWRRLPA